MSRSFCTTVPPEAQGKRLDVFLMDFVRDNNLGISRTYLKELIDGGRVRVAGTDSVSAHYKVREGQEVELDLVEKQQAPLEPEDIPLKVVCEDDDIAVIDKPAGLVTHPAPGNRCHTLVNALLFRVKKLSTVNPDRPGIVHRLDKETSGIMVVARTNEAHFDLARQFEDHTITRRYVALVKGRVEFNEDVIEAPIDRDAEHRENMKVDFSPEARYAKTRYKVLERGDDFSYLELEPYTGRTHQLRVHLAYIGHPVLGDSKYGRHNPFPRMALHAKTLGFIHPETKKYMEFTSEPPKEFTDFVKKHRTKAKAPARRQASK
ncbi:MAG: RluA family pseudouridine synthase [Deltaproteobacteria bacterium]